MPDELLTAEERRVLDRLVGVWNAFLELPTNGNERTEFMQIIHAAQNAILARPAIRVVNSQPPARPTPPPTFEYTP